MILVDTSVWIDYFKNTQTPQVELLDSAFGRRRIAIGDLIAAEVLQGVRDDKEYNFVKKTFSAYDQVELVGFDIALKAAKNYRFLRSKGITIRKTIDTLIATKCIEEGIALLHDDLDFPPFAKHLGLIEAFPSA
jgi:predicted nucleic acid-binding protein